MFQNKEDLRIYNTKQFVYEAFVELLKIHPYTDISISMIIKKAGIGRSTFYRHFYTKDDIILFMLNYQTLNMSKLIISQFDLSIYNEEILDKIIFFFQYWDDHPEIIELIIALDKIQLLYITWPTFLMEMFSVANIAISSNASHLYTAHFALGGLISLLIQWFKNDRKESVEYVSKHFYIPN